MFSFYDLYSKNSIFRSMWSILNIIFETHYSNDGISLIFYFALQLFNCSLLLYFHCLRDTSGYVGGIYLIRAIITTDTVLSQAKSCLVIR